MSDKKIDELVKEISLYTRFKVFLENEYLNLTIKPDTCCTQEEFNNAEKWAEKITKHLLSSIVQWTKDNKPGEKILTSEDFESWINIRKENKEAFHKYLKEHIDDK